MKLECSGKGIAVGDTISYSWYITYDKSGTDKGTQEQLKSKGGRLYVDTKGELPLLGFKL